MLIRKSSLGYGKHLLCTGWRTMGQERNPEEHRTGHLLLRMSTHCIECIAFCRPGMSASSRAPFLQTQSTVRDLGAYIDSGMSFTDHVTRLTRTCFFHIRQLRSIRRSLTVDSSHALVRALILTRLDYCNGLLGGAPKCLLSPLSRVLRAAARLILLLPRTSSVENKIRTVLHWLDVPARVTFKLCLLAHRCLHGSAPPYLIQYFTPVSSIAGRSHLRHGHGVCAWIADVDDWTSGVRHLLSVCMEQSTGWSAWSRAQSSDLQTFDSRLICLILLVNYLLP